VLTSGGVGVVPAYSAAPTLTGALTNNLAGIAVTSTDGHVLSNTTAATAGVPVQQSPRLRFRSNVWNTTVTAANNTNDWWVDSVPISQAVPTGQLIFRSSLNGAAATDAITFNSFGEITALSNINAVGDLRSGGARFIYFNTREAFSSTADGLLNITTNAGSLGVQLNTGATTPTVTSCGTGAVTAGSRNVAGQITATGATACTITFSSPAWTNAPFCTITMRNVPLTAAYISAESTTAFTVTGLTAADVFNYICIGRI
jgi:hypothetical protein